MMASVETGAVVRAPAKEDGKNENEIECVTGISMEGKKENKATCSHGDGFVPQRHGGYERKRRRLKSTVVLPLIQNNRLVYDSLQDIIEACAKCGIFKEEQEPEEGQIGEKEDERKGEGETEGERLQEKKEEDMKKDDDSGEDAVEKHQNKDEELIDRGTKHAKPDPESLGLSWKDPTSSTLVPLLSLEAFQHALNVHTDPSQSNVRLAQRLEKAVSILNQRLNGSAAFEDVGIALLTLHDILERDRQESLAFQDSRRRASGRDQQRNVRERYVPMFVTVAVVFVPFP